MLERLRNNHALIVGIVSVVVVLVVLLFVYSVYIFSRQDVPGNGNGNNQTPTSTTTSAGETPERPLDLLSYEFAGVKSDGTLALFSTNMGEAIISLDSYNWQNLKWSPDGNLLAALGASDSQSTALDLYIYNLKSQQWRRSTNYGSFAIGVKSYLWTSDTTIAYVQAVGNDSWLHRYDYGNQEIVKVFQTSDYITHFQPATGRYITRQASGSRIVDLSGNVIHSFPGAIDSGSKTLLRVMPGRSQDEYFIITTADGQIYPYSWVLGESTYSPIILLDDGTEEPVSEFLNPICLIDTRGMFVQLIKEGSSSFGRYDFSSMVFVPLINIDTTDRPSPDKSQCHKGSVLFSLEIENETHWYKATEVAGIEIETASNYSDVAIKDIS